MHCPVCKSASPVLAPHPVTEHLSSSACSVCGGQWIRGEHYYQWIDRSAKDETATLTGEPPQPASHEHHDSTKAKLCPECGRFLTRYRVGHGADFVIDRCGNCAGIWLDSSEFELLRSMKLHDKMHFVFSAAWQADNVRADRERAETQRLTERLRDVDFAEIRRVS